MLGQFRCLAACGVRTYVAARRRVMDWGGHHCCVDMDMHVVPEALG
jgi:hypothetical protein